MVDIPKVPDRLKSRKFLLTLGTVLAIVGKCLQQGTVQPEDIAGVVAVVTGYNYTEAKIDQAKVFSDNAPK